MTVESLVRHEPVMTAHVGLTTAVVMYAAFVPHLTPAEMAAVATIVTALSALVSAFLTKPVNLGVIHAAIASGLVAAAAFGLHLSAPETAALATAIVSVLGYLLREKVSPVVGEVAH
jgi:hypothetical protein